jgi:hypothetical protein
MLSLLLLVSSGRTPTIGAREPVLEALAWRARFGRAGSLTRPLAHEYRPAALVWYGNDFT